MAGPLGEVRNADAVEQRLSGHDDELPDSDASGLPPLLAKLEVERGKARRQLREALSSDRYANLLDRLATGVLAPPVVRDGDTAARKALPGLARRPWKHLRKAVDGLPPDPASEDLHGVRILAKRVRYGAEAAAPVCGKKTEKFAEAVARLEAVLGRLQDAAMAEAWLRAAVGGAPATQALVAGQLIALQRAEGAASRAAWPKTWKRVDRKKLTAWLS